jgi:hypothetical protein
MRPQEHVHILILIIYGRDHIMYCSVTCSQEIVSCLHARGTFSNSRTVKKWWAQLRVCFCLRPTLAESLCRALYINYIIWKLSMNGGAIPPLPHVSSLHGA